MRKMESLPIRYKRDYVTKCIWLELAFGVFWLSMVVPLIQFLLSRYFVYICCHYEYHFWGQKVNLGNDSRCHALGIHACNKRPTKLNYTNQKWQKLLPFRECWKFLQFFFLLFLFFIFFMWMNSFLFWWRFCFLWGRQRERERFAAIICGRRRLTMGLFLSTIFNICSIFIPFHIHSHALWRHSPLYLTLTILSYFKKKLRYAEADCENWMC